MLKICLGTDEKKETELSETLKSLDDRIKKEEKHKTGDERNRKSYEKKYEATLETARALKLIDSGEFFEREDILARIKNEVEYFNRIKRSHAKLKELAELSDKQRRLKAEIDSYRKLKWEYNRAIRYAQKVEDSLTPFEYLERRLNKQVMSEDSVALFKSLQDAFTASKKITLKPDELPAEFEENLKRKKEEYQRVTNKLEEDQWIIDNMFEQDKLVRLFALAKKKNMLATWSTIS